jgi:GNAT superfamily N-acetyltransferase
LISGLWERLEVEFANKRHWPRGTPGGKGGKFAPGDAQLPGDSVLADPIDVRRLTTYPSRVQEASRFLGRTVDVPSLAFLAGAIPGSVTGFTPGRAFGGSPQWSAWSHGDDPDLADWHTQVYFSKDKEENKILYLNLMEVNKSAQAQGIGLRVLCAMVDEAVRQGIPHIELWAAGHGDGTLDKHRWAGYYTWARLGFDSQIRTHYQGKEVHTIHELLAMPGGREHWYRHGHNYGGIFDLRENSYSRAVLRSYAQSKGLTVDFANTRRWPKGTPGGKGGKFMPKDAQVVQEPMVPREAAEKPIDVKALGEGELAYAKDLLGHPVDPVTLARLAGALPGCGVLAYPRGALEVRCYSLPGEPSWETSVQVQGWPARLHVNLVQVSSDAQAQGIGTRILTTLIGEAVHQGIHHVSLEAVGRGNGTLDRHREAGYYTWARLGFDGPVAFSEGPFQHVSSLHELLDLPGGREYWYRYGVKYQGIFDLREGSRSRAILRSYAQSKGLTVHFANKRHWPKGTPGGKGGKFMPRDAVLPGEEAVQPVVPVPSPPVQPIRTDRIPDEAVEHASDILGHPVDRSVIARLAGAIPGSEVISHQLGDALVMTCASLIDARDAFPAWETGVTLNPGPPSRIHIGLVRVSLDARGQGQGTQILSTLISEAVKQGIHHVTLTADGRGDGTLDKQRISGYYTWARLGFDGPVAFSEGPFQHVSSLHELLDLPGGREYWYRHGAKYQGIFDLREGSRSRAILREYAKVKGIQVDFSEVQDFPELFQFLSEVTEKTSRGLLVDYGLPPGKEEEDPVSADFSRPFDPAGWEPYILRRGRRKGTPVYKKGREYRDFLPTHAPERQELDRRLFDGIAFSNLSHDQRILYTTTMTSILDRLPPVALSRVHQHVQTFRFYPDLVSVGTDMSQRDRQWVLTEPGFTKKDRDEHLLVYLKNMEQARRGHLGGGIFYPYKEIFLDGPPTGSSSHADISSWGPNPIQTTLNHIYAHELTHAIDGDKQLRNNPTWYNAWVKDLVKKPAATTYPLSAYASEGGVHEGLAEFGRLIYSGQFDLGKVEQRYPNCTAFFKSQRLWPTS